MPLTLVTGPANAAKAGEVLGGLRARLDEDPILVVPSFQDVEHAQRELAERGAVFGALVLRFEWLYREIARRVGVGERVASEVQRQLLLEATVAKADLSVLSESAAQPGFVRAAARFVAELGRARVDPGRFTQALRAWAGDGPRRGYADEVAAIYARLPAGARARRPGGPGAVRLASARRAAARPRRAGAPRRCSCTASTTSPRSSSMRWRRCPARCGADVTRVAPLRAGRQAFRAMAAVHARLSEIATERIELPRSTTTTRPPRAPRSIRWSAASSRSIRRAPVDAGEAVAFHAAGGARAEVELAGGAGARPPARGHLARRRGGGVPRPDPLLHARGAGLRRLRGALLASTARCPSPTPAWAAGCSR